MLDRVRGIAYLNVSERADVGLAEQWVHDLGYKVRPALPQLPCGACVSLGRACVQALVGG